MTEPGSEAGSPGCDTGATGCSSPLPEACKLPVLCLAARDLSGSCCYHHTNTLGGTLHGCVRVGGSPPRFCCLCSWKTACSPVSLMTFLCELPARALWSCSVAPEATWIKYDNRGLSGFWMLHERLELSSPSLGHLRPGCRVLSCLGSQAALLLVSGRLRNCLIVV